MKTLVCAFLGALLSLLFSVEAHAMAGVGGYVWLQGTAACTPGAQAFSVGSSPPASCGQNGACASVVLGAAVGGANVDDMWFKCMNAAGTVVNAQYVYRRPACQTTVGVTGYSSMAARDADCQQTPTACTSLGGTGNLKNYTIGWSRRAGSETVNTLQVEDIVGSITLPPTTSCDAGCEASTGGMGAMYGSNTPTAQGLFRLSVDAYTQYSGSTCPTPTPALTPNAPSPSCVGFVGAVNGLTRCVAATGQTPTNSTAPVTPGTVGNPTAGSDGAGGLTSRTPVSGDGGSGGGPLTSSDGHNRGGGTTAGGASLGSGTGADPTPDPCIANPTRSGCVNLGDAPAAEAIPSQNVPVAWSLINFSSMAACPADVSFSGPIIGSRSISMSSLCDLMLTLQPIFLMIGAVAAAMIFMEGLKS